MPLRTTTDSARWPTTQWDVVQTLSEEAARRRALARLCCAYDRPILAYLVQMGFSRYDAEDVRQSFFKDVVLGRNLLRRARQGRGRLRDYIRRSLHRYALNTLRDGRAARREGAWRRESSEHLHAPKIAAGATVPRVESPAERFAREWATGLLERAQARLDEEYERRGNAALCEALKPHLVRWTSPPSQAEVARTFGVTATSLSTELNRLRKRFRHVLLLLLSE